MVTNNKSIGCGYLCCYLTGVDVFDDFELIEAAACQPSGFFDVVLRALRTAALLLCDILDSRFCTTSYVNFSLSHFLFVLWSSLLLCYHRLPKADTLLLYDTAVRQLRYL